MPTTSLFSLTDRVALVTGGGTHLGRAMAEALAEYGAHVYIAGRRVAVVEATAEQMRSAELWCRALKVDVTQPETLDAALAQIAESSGPLDIAVCNAGANYETRFPPRSFPENFCRTVESHLMGAFYTAHAAAQQMIPRGAGSIIMVSSIHGGLAADPRLYEGLGMEKRSGPAYQSAKAAIIGLTRNLAAELGRHGVRVNCISPGYIPGPQALPEFVERCRSRNALGIIGKVEDLKGAALLLASDAGRFMTGHNLVIDGGWSIW